MLRSGNLFNKNELQKECGLDNRTFDSYFNVLQHSYQVQKLKPFFKNELKRVIKSPKIYATDTGVLSHLLQITSIEEYEKSNYKGDILETFVYDELIKANTYSNARAGLFYYRTSDKKEIDFILEFSNKVVAIEVKSSKTVSKNDFKHIYHLAKEIPNEFDKGIVFYNGEQVLKLDDNIDERSDIYSLGISMWTILTGKVPFYHKIPEVIANLQIAYPLPRHPKIPENLWEIIQKATVKPVFNKSFNKYAKKELITMLQEAKNLRYMSAQEMIVDLRKII